MGWFSDDKKKAIAKADQKRKKSDLEKALRKAELRRKMMEREQAKKAAKKREEAKKAKTGLSTRRNPKEKRTSWW